MPNVYGDHRTDASAAIAGQQFSTVMNGTITAGKYLDGTPLYQMGHALARAGIEVARDTLANWIIRPAKLHCNRLNEALRRTLVAADETGRRDNNAGAQGARQGSAEHVVNVSFPKRADCPEPVVMFDY
jgi:transposase